MTPQDLETLIDTPVLRTERLILRAPRAADEPAWTAFVQDERSRFIGGPLTAGRGWRTFASLIGHWLMRGTGCFVLQLKDDPAPLGQVGPWFPGDWPEREVGWTLWTPEAEGKGYATEAARAVLAHVFRDLGWPTAVSYIDPDNSRSIAVAERLGAVARPGRAAAERRGGGLAPPGPRP